MDKSTEQTENNHSRLGETRPRDGGWRPVLRRMDPAGVSVLVAFALIGMAAYWFVQGEHRGELIEIDRAQPLSAKYLVDINKAEWPDNTTLKVLTDLVFSAKDLPQPHFDSR